MYLIFSEIWQGSISFGLNNSRIFCHFSKDDTVFFFQHSLPCRQMARRAKKEEVTGGGQN